MPRPYEPCINIVDTSGHAFYDSAAVNPPLVREPKPIMEAIVKKWGNSAALRLPASVLKAAKISLEQTVEVSVEDGRVVIQPAHQHVFRIDDLVSKITPANRHEAVDTGPAMGKELL